MAYKNLKCINFIEWTGPTERTEAERGFYLLLEKRQQNTVEVEQQQRQQQQQTN